MELLWALLIVFGFIYARFCTNKKIVIVVYGIMLFIVNLELIINKQVVVNRCGFCTSKFVSFKPQHFAYWLCVVVYSHKVHSFPNKV